MPICRYAAGVVVLLFLCHAVYIALLEENTRKNLMRIF